MSERWWHGTPESGCLLLAAPSLTDPNFSRSVVYVIEHGEDGTLGVVINRPSRTPVGAVLPTWQDLMSDPAVVHEGGPVQRDGALCLAQLLEPVATREVEPVAIKPTSGGVGLVDLDAEADVVAAQASAMRVFAGHSGWTEGQLEAEVAEGAWFVLPGRARDIFSADSPHQWSALLRRQPFPLSLVSTFPLDPAEN
jgi:putative transcriptional regulator